MIFLGDYDVLVFRVCVNPFYSSCCNFYAYTDSVQFVIFLCVSGVKSYAVVGGAYYCAVHGFLGAVCTRATGVRGVFWVRPFFIVFVVAARV